MSFSGSHEFQAKLWRWMGDAPAAWFFITLPVEVASEIRFFNEAQRGGKRRGFGSVRVSATIGETQWKTSLFPDKKSGSYFLPVKFSVRKAEDLAEDKVVRVKLSIIS